MITTDEKRHPPVINEDQIGWVNIYANVSLISFFVLHITNVHGKGDINMNHPFRKMLSFIMIIALTAFIAACGSGDVGDDDDELTVLEVDLEAPEKADVGETVEFKATVTYGDEDVTDADEVVYEVWKDDEDQDDNEKDQESEDDQDAGDEDDMFSDDSEMIEATNHKDGTYTAETSFDEDGVYTVQVHVTARDLHTMPLQDIIVGEGSTEDEDHDEHGDEEGVSLHFVEPEDVSTDEEVELMTHLQIDNEALTGANVTYEIENEDAEDEREKVEAEETKDGEYSAPFTFTDEGTYQIHVQVEDEENDVQEDETYEVEVGS